MDRVTRQGLIWETKHPHLSQHKDKKGVAIDALALPLFSRIVQVDLKVATMSPGAG
jgi:hypothetical protein